MRRLAGILFLAAFCFGCAGAPRRVLPLGQNPDEEARFDNYEYERIEWLSTDTARIGDKFFNAEEIETYFESQDAFEAAEGFPGAYLAYGSAKDSQDLCMRCGCLAGIFLGAGTGASASTSQYLWFSLPAGGLMGGYAGWKLKEGLVLESKEKLSANVDLFDQVLRRKYKIPENYPAGLDLR